MWVGNSLIPPAIFGNSRRTLSLHRILSIRNLVAPIPMRTPHRHSHCVKNLCGGLRSRYRQDEKDPRRRFNNGGASTNEKV